MPDAPTELAATLGPYLPRLLTGWLAGAPGTTLRAVDGTMVYVDISGFTKMSERLARNGKVGAEEVTDVIGAVFAQLLALAYGVGGGLIKFGGDALLLFFSGEEHARRGAIAAVGMRKALRDIGPIETSAGKVALRMSIGVHSGAFHFFLVGESHRELVITGPAATETATMESEASAGEILVSRATADLLPEVVIGKAKGDGFLLRGAPLGLRRDASVPEPVLDGVDLLSCIPLAIREHVLSGLGEPEHRAVTVAFVHFDGIDRLVSDLGSDVVAFGLDQLVSQVQAACEKNGVTFLGSDVDKDGGKIILVAGAPSAQGDDEERVLLTVRAIVDADTTIPVRIGVNRGPVFAGDIGPSYRRTYTVMGDTVNLAARVMAKALPGEILVTEPVLAASAVRFETEALEPFMVKGKKHPVVAHRLGAIVGSSRTDGLADLALVGRAGELDVLRAALEGTLEGRGALAEVTGDAGVGKSRLLLELETLAAGRLPWHAVACEPYEASTPYFPFRPLLRALLGISEDLGHDQLAATFAARVEQACPELMPWLPLLALPLDLEIPDTPEVAALDERFRRERMEGAIGDLLVEFGGGPAAAVIEDAQWMDDASSDLLDAITARMDELPLLVLVARRDGAAREELLTEAAGEHRIRLTLGPLSTEDAVDLIHEATQEHPLTPHAVEALAHRSGGSPRFLKAMLYEVIRSGGSVDQLPGSVEGVVMTQIDRLSPRDRTLLRYLSVLGMSFGEELVARVLEGEGIEADLAASRTFEGMIEPDGRGGFRFRNGLVRDVAYESLPFRRRRELHARVGEAIRTEAGDDADDVAELLSLHFFYAQRFEDAWRYSRLSAEHAVEIYANVEARDFFLRALDAGGRLPALDPSEYAAASEALGDVRMRLGEPRSAEEAYRAARRRVVGDALGEARLLLKEALVLDVEGRYPQALRTLTRGTRLLAEGSDPGTVGLRAQLAAHYAGIRWAQGRNDEAIRWCRAALADGEAASELDATAHALYVLDVAEHSLGVSKGGPYSERALKLYERLGNLAKQGDVMNNLGYYAYFRGNWSEALTWYERARDVFLRTGNVVDAAIDDTNIGEVLVFRGCLEEAAGKLAGALRVFRASGVKPLEVFALTLLAATASRTGRFDEAATMYEQADALVHEVGDEHGADVTGLRAESLILQGRPDEAIRIIDGLLATLPATHAFVPWLLRNRGYALAQANDRGAAQAALRESLSAARASGADHDVAFALEALLRCDLSDGRSADEMRRERDELNERLGIVAVPTVPVRMSC